MEIFAAATGCSDREVASLYLARAGDDVTRAVNHFLDSPSGGPPSPNGSRTSGGLLRAGDGRSTEDSPRRSYKRQRGEPGGGKPSSKQFRQLCVVFEQVRPSAGGSTSGVRHPQTQANFTHLLKQCPKQRLLGAASHRRLRPTLPFLFPLGPRPYSQRTQFEDGSFLPRPSSLDGRAGRGDSALPRDGKSGGGTEKQDKENARCKCGMSARIVTVSKAGGNQGRLFYGCVARKCDFFRWADDAPHTKQALSLVWRRFSLPRFKLSAAAGGGTGGSGFKPQDIRQGAVGDCWFLAGLAVISERPDLIGRVVGSNGPTADECGCYEVNLFKDGRWECVMVDNWLPCKDPARLKGKEKGLDHIPAFAKASNNQTWPCIAFAKQHGSYDAISGGHVCDAFEALTGAPTETVMLADSDDSECNWAKLLSFSQAGFPMGCATAWDPTRGLRDVGLVSTHAYSVLEV
ncbi:unnamed protein product, partial [Scytosiphon promiscuus]